MPYCSTILLIHLSHFIVMLTPEEITKLANDRSYILESILDKSLGGDFDGILAELQYAFVCFFVGQCMDALFQWKTIILLLCNCVSAMKSRREDFNNFVDVIIAQLEHIPEDFFIDWISADDNFIGKSLKSLIFHLKEIEAKDTAFFPSSSSNLLVNRVKSRFHYDLEDVYREYEDEELDAALVVDLNESLF